ncbi:uncharacterized protein [Maniola hyperantus]|uniref:uncharacterized protein n=1 Tax=Aphantopus hyperantus TaxID=2795564 RepID=UPI001568DBF8|nr:uncharacterized protein LOC117986603 [Maniola hyperantus]
MWKIIPDDITEPIELRELKLELANNTCKCKLCAIRNSSLDIGVGCYDKEVQVKNSRSYIDRFPQTLYGTKSLTNADTSRKDTFCAGCHIAMVMNLLSSKKARVLKDEESETKSEIFSCDKSTERAVTFAEKITSTIEELKENHSELSLCDMMSEYSTDMSTYFTRNRKRNNEKVTFEETTIQKPKVPAISRNCLCLENFVNSIRPPLACDFMHFK